MSASGGRLCRALYALSIAAALALLPASAHGQTRAFVDVVTDVSGVIDPPVAEYIDARLRAAEADRVHAVVIQMDTPGGLDVSMRDIIRTILDSDVPVVVWVAPRGARAASAGTFIAYAAHLVYMAEATEIGAATPVNLGGDQDETLSRKAVNDAVAFITELAETRGRNAEWAEAAVRDAASVGAREAVEIDVADGIASSLRELLQALDGRGVEVATGERVTLDTWDAARAAPAVTLRFQEMTPFQKLLHTITNPEIAFLLMLLGTFGLIFELYNPGIGLAGILGAVALLMSFYALNVLPTNWAGVLLVVLGVVFLVVDLQAAGLGIWTVGGVAALIAGALVLFSGASPALALSPWAIAAAVGLSLLFFVSVMTAALRVRLRRPITGEEAMVGMIGEARTDIAPEGMVMTKGTLWRARTMETGIAAGAKVRVMASEGTVLLVEPLREHEGA